MTADTLGGVAGSLPLIAARLVVGWRALRLIGQADQAFFISVGHAYAFDGLCTAWVSVIRKLDFADIVLFELLAGSERGFGWFARWTLSPFAGSLSGWLWLVLRLSADRRGG